MTVVMASTVRPLVVGPAGAPLIDPETGRALRYDTPWSLTDGANRWPVVEGIPYLRVGRETLRSTCLQALDAGGDRAALVLLLADQDDYARIAPPDSTTLDHLADAVGSRLASLRQAMTTLNYGPVADYFAHRWSSPTYLSGLALLDNRAEGAAVVEVACGIGHYLRDLSRQGVACGGLDVVFSKLWLARRFLVGNDVPLVCADASQGWPLGQAPGPTVAFCHDAFYFLPEKPRVVASLQSLVGDLGAILIGHAHNRLHDHAGVAGEPKTTAEYAAMLPGCSLMDDAELARSEWTDTPAPARSAESLANVEAVAILWPGGISPLSRPRPTAKLRLNPILIEAEDVLRPAWPSERFEAEYADASPYLTGEAIPSAQTLRHAENGTPDPEVDRLARRRILLDLPERW